MNKAIHSDAFDATEEFLNRWTKDAEKPSEGTAGDTEEDTEDETSEDDEGSEGEGTGDEQSPNDETDDDESDEGSDEEREADEDEGEGSDEPAESKEGKKVVIDSEDAVVKIKVDGEEVEASIKDLKRLYGQETALNRKSQEAAAIRKNAEEAGAMHVAGLDALLQRAKQAYEPYSKLNFVALAKDPTVTAEEYTALHEAAQAHFDNVRFLSGELDGVVKFHQQKRQEQLVTQAKETHKLLSDPKTGIEGWSEPLYNDIRAFAMEQGLDKQFVDEVVDPVGIKILHMAMQYAKGKKVVAEGNKGIKKVDKSPKKIVKGQAAETVNKSKVKSKDAALKRLRSSGSTDDAAEAFLARWEK